jgi:hypothetical protein
MKRILPSLFAACAVLSGLPASAQDYHSNDLTPPGAGSGKLTSTSASGKQVGGSQATGSYSPHAVLLDGNALTAIDLNPASAYYSMATCNDDLQQGGWAYFPTGLHATVWSGSSSSCVDLNPSGYNFSYCLGVHNGEQVGYAQQQSYFISASHAFCWHGSAAGVDLHAGTYAFSRAVACHDGEEVGYVSQTVYPEGDYVSYRTLSHAVSWHGTAASALDLHPVGFDSSEATCTNGTQEGGWGYIALGTSHLHALLWSGDAASVVDLHPAGYTDTRLNAITATKQVGEGWVGAPGAFGSVRHALLWTGTADSVVDLNQYLPAGYTNGVATGIDANGNVVGYAYNNFVSGATIQQGAKAVVFAPGAAPAGRLASIALSPANVAPGATTTVTVTLATPAPVGGTNVAFLSSNTTMLAKPAPITIAEGDTTASFSVTAGGAALAVPSTFNLYANDGTTGSSANLTITPVVNITSITGNTVEGGLSTSATVALSIPAQVGGAVVSLTNGDASLIAMPSSVTVPQGWSSLSFTVTTSPVAVATTVPITATFNGQTVSGSIALSPQPVVTLAAVSIPDVVGGQSVVGTVSLSNWVRNPAGLVVNLSSGDAKTLQVPASITIPYGYASGSFTATTVVVSGAKGVSVKATSSNSNISTTLTVNPIPPITFVSADWDPVTLLFKVQATTNDNTAIFTFGTDAASGPIGTMQLELGIWKGSILMPTAPTTATIWSSFGASASMPVTNKGLTSGGGGGGGGVKTGGGGGGGTTTTSSTYKISIATTGKGTVTTSPSGTSFAAGTVVTLTATPAAGSPWVGWSGAVVSKSQTITVTVNSNLSLTANFK